MFERLSEWISATSFAMRRVRLDDMAGGNVKMSLWKASCRWVYNEERWLEIEQSYCSDSARRLLCVVRPVGNLCL